MLDIEQMLDREYHFSWCKHDEIEGLSFCSHDEIHEGFITISSKEFWLLKENIKKILDVSET